MKFKNKNLFYSLVVLSLAACALAACQPRASKNGAGDGPFQCISATIMVAGKPTTTVVEWNEKTGMARILDSMVVTSKATGSQNVVIGWIPLGDLQGAIQEIVNRNQAMQQQAPPTAQSVTPSAVQETPAAPSTKKRK
ncbi:MAG: hypothetical protein NT164_01455 [Verrucomicrobiae bacterium]|nr:hypothetical protein [Verrucomicrobiae bacterium]